MADLKISALNSLAGADLVAADVVAVVDDSASETKKLTVSDLIANGTTLISDATIPSAKILFSAGSVATASVADAGITTAKVADSSITAAKLADNSSVTLVSALPGSGSFVGQVALDTDDSKIYVWSGSAWTSVKGAGSINVVSGSTTGEINIVTSTSGDTVTVSATLDNTTAAAQFLAGPTGAGGTVGYRAIIGADLPTATTTAKGGVIVNGNGLTMSSDTIAINNTVTAETSENHIVQYDANGLITGGRAIVAADVPVATSSANGIVKPGSGLGVTGAGALNHNNAVTAGTASKVTFDTEGHITGTESLVAADIPDLDADKITTGTVPTARIASDAVTADKLADRSTATIAETTPAGGAFIGQCHLNSITGDYFLWDGNVWQPIGISVGEIILAGTYDASTNLMATVTAEGTALSFVVGSALPAASASNKGYYVVVSEAGTGTSPAPTVALNPPDFLLSTGTAYTEIDVSSTVTAQQASNVAFTAAGNISATNVQSAIEELDTEKVAAASPSLTGTVSIGTGGTIQFEGATANDFESTLTVVDPTADRTLSLPDATGTLVSTGDTGTVTSTMITDGTIVNADINASAEIAVSKLANGTARQLLQTDVAGSGVEFTSNIDVPGTLDVTGAATLDSTLGVTGLISADGKVKFPAGSASAPSFYSGTDTNTGLYFSAADEISVATGGTQRVVVDSSGRLLVGRSSASSNVKIDSNLATPSFQIEGSTYQTAAISLTRTANSSPYIYLNSGSSGNNATSSLARIMFNGFDGTNYVSAASLAADVDGTPGTNDMPGRLIFSTTADGASSPSERLRIDSSGRLMVGTTTEGDAAADNLTVADSGNCGMTLRSGSSSVASIYFSDATSGAGEYAGYFQYVHSSNYLNIGVNGADAIRIDSSGRLMIQNTSAGSLNAGADDLVVGSGSGDQGITIYTGSSSQGSFYFADGTSGAQQYAGGINYSHSDNELRFLSNGSTNMRLDSSGNLRVGMTGNPGSGNDGLIVNPSQGLLVTADGQPVFRGYSLSAGSPTSTVNSDGSATFTGNLQCASDKIRLVTDSSAGLIRVLNSSSVDTVGLEGSTGNATFAGTVTDSIGNVRRVGIHSASANFTLTTDHPGKLVRMSGSGKTIAVPQNVLSAGDMVTMFNVSTGTMTIEQGTGTTIYNSADGATGNRTVAAKGMVTLVCTASNEFVISGTQLS